MSRIQVKIPTREDLQEVDQKGRTMFKEFKAFAMRGNVIDLAVGVIIGGAFGKIVTSLVNDLVMPLVSRVTGKVDFKTLFVSLNGTHYDTLEEAKKAAAPILTYGNFLQTVVDFLIVALVIFLVIRQINKLNPKPVEPPATKDCPECASKVPIKAIRCAFCTQPIR